jgi:hypothetical protein
MGTRVIISLMADFRQGGFDAWIETGRLPPFMRLTQVQPRVGAWIETTRLFGRAKTGRAPACGLKQNLSVHAPHRLLRMTNGNPDNPKEKVCLDKHRAA